MGLRQPERAPRTWLRRVAQTAVIALCLAGVLTAGAASARNCTEEEKAAADRQLWLSKADKQRSLEHHLPWGAPQPRSESEELLIHRDYVIGYDRELRVPLWTAHRLDAQTLGESERVDCFRRDPRVDSSAASLATDYREPIFDQGHMTPNGDMTHGLLPVINSFVLSNMAPQYCQFNRGAWQIFESIVRLWAKEKTTIYVLTGSVFDRDGDGKRDANSVAKRMKSNNGKTRVAVPSHFYKIVVHQKSDGTVEALAVLLPHDQTDVDGDAALRHLSDNVRTIAALETIAGYTFFPKVTGEAAAIKRTKPEGLWPFKGRAAKSLVFAPCSKTAGVDR